MSNLASEPEFEQAYKGKWLLYIYIYIYIHIFFSCIYMYILT